MAKDYQISPNLIEQVQILLRKEAGVESLNSIDHSHVDDSLQQSCLNEAIFGSKSSENALRCKNCEGELLRGSDSIICVYCGHAQLQDARPISFKSSFAFQWFLQSLNLDGFENVGKQIGGTEWSDRGRGSFKEEEVLLSEFLDLQLKWAGDDLRGFGVKDEEQLSGKRYLNLVGVDVEEILAQDRRDHEFSSVRNEQAITIVNNKNEQNKNSGERDLNLFENMQSSGTALRSGEGNEFASDWGADFQAAFPGPGHEKIAGFSVSDDFSGINSTTSGISLENLENGPPFDSKISDRNILSGKALGSDTSFECLPADQPHTTEKDSLNNEKIDEDGDSFDEWGDFSMSRSDNISQSEPSSGTVPDTDNSGQLALSDQIDDFNGSTLAKGVKHQSNIFTVPDDAWNNFTTTVTGGIQSQVISSNSEHHVDSGDPAHAKVNDSFGLWNNDVHSGIEGDKLHGRDIKSPASGATNELDDSFNLWNTLKGSNNQQEATTREVPDIGTSAGGSDTYDEWNDFASFGVGKKEEQANSLEVVRGNGNFDQSDSFAYDAWNDFTTATTSGGVSDSKPIDNDISSGVWNDFSSLMVSHTNQPQNSNTATSENQANFEDDDLFSSLNLRSTTQTVNSFLGPNNIKSISDQISFQDNNLKIVKDNTTLSAWGDFGGAASLLEQQLQASGAGSSENELSSGGGGLFSGLSSGGKQSTNHPDNQLHGNGVKTLGETRENDDTFGAWSDFTSSSNVKAGISGLVNAPDDKESIKHGDIFDAWDAIVSSPIVEAGNDTAVPKQKVLEFNLPVLDISSQYAGPENSMQPDVSVGMFSNHNGSVLVPVSPTHGSNTVGTKHGDAKADDDVDMMNPRESTSKEIVAEALISEMHDLSFMLESGLSIPKSCG